MTMLADIDSSTTLRFVPVADRPACEMCFVEDAIAYQGTVPICDGCITEYSIDPFTTGRIDGLPNAWVSPAQYAAANQTVAGLVSKVDEARQRLAVIDAWSRLDEAARGSVALEAILGADAATVTALGQRIGLEL